MFAERRIEIVDELGDMEPILILGDKDRLTQVFSNLLENTLSYTDSPGSLSANSALGGKTYSLNGGGYLAPK